MFTGIIENTGEILEKSENQLVFEVPKSFDLILGASIAVNGTCLTVAKLKGQIITADILEETWKRTNLGELKAGDLVNLERPARINATLDGHIVQGHVDGVGKLVGITDGKFGHKVEIEVPENLTKYMVEKGSVAVDGISLTIIDIKKDHFTFESIPHTWEITNLHSKKNGDGFNIEVDVLAKYVEKLVAAQRTAESNSAV